MQQNTECPTKMIELTVRTLDSQNHPFTVEDDITVEQFKTRIADTVNIPADIQRIIYCGRVLQDSSKLSDYDVNGKVVHLVQRAPPSATDRSSSRSASPQPPRRTIRGFRGFDQGNTMYLGSMAFPSNLMESQGIIPPPPTHSLSGSRLNVARRMLRRAEAVLNLLENPSARPEEQNQTDENQEEEVTPVIEARVIVPNNNGPINDVINAVQNSLIEATGGTLNRNGRVSETRGNSSNRLSSEERLPDLTNADPPRRSASADNLSFEQRPDNTTELPENASRTSEMSELLTQLAQLQVRFAPFLERYQSFMQEDPEISSENQRAVQTMLNRVSEVLHFLGHAYHSLSDIMVRVRATPPRPLLCRPILIQHSAVVQTGFPIQVEAQINLSAQRPQTGGGGTAATTEGDATAPQPANGAAAAAPNAEPPPTPGGRPTFADLAFLPPGAAMRVQSFPVEIRAVQSTGPPPRAQAAAAAAQNNNNNNAAAVYAAAAAAAASFGQRPQQTQGSGTGTGTATTGGGSGFNLGNPNVEFFMEVTPEGITIDSLETTVVGSNQANDLIRESLNGPPTEFLQSLMQMASHIMARNAQAPPTTASATTATTTEAQAASQQAGQNTQARGNSQTQPTTATHTRSTARPHVHLAQQAVQAGFDPFLPCNSHHISRRRQQPQSQQAQQRQTAEPPQQSTTASSTTTSTPQETPPAAPPPPSGQRPTATGNFQSQNVMSLVNGIFESLRTQHVSSVLAAATASAAANMGDAPNNPGQELLHSLFQGLAADQGNARGQGLTAIDQVLQTLLDQYITGENIITELPMLFIRNLTIVDLFTLCEGNIEPLNRNSAEVQNFVRTRWCNGDTTPEGINNAVDRVIAELQPFLAHLNTLPVRNDIDLVRSSERVFRQRLPTIINLALRLNVGGNLQLLIQQLLSTAKTLLALALHASANGQQGVEQILDQIIVRNIINPQLPQDFQNLTLMTSRVQLRQLIANLNIPDSVLQQYIVRRSDPSTADTNQTVSGRGNTQEVEAMDLDEPEATGSTYSSPTSEILEDPEPLPNVIIGSEPWHAQVPEDWVPIITRDAQKQRRQNPQGPFSDGYLSGMPSKRRKIVNSAKPQGSLPQVITESVRQAVSSTGLTAAAPLETVAQLAGASPEIQTAYRNLLRSTVQANLRDNADFLPERFPNAAAYFDVDH
ncbi:unnamed protein product [Callosobruchus maculatus]|uniref:Large proline-rich protein BAG6 n=1 Tax=Callosobruchus maculatus TaxID=64391 RepID=A0A653D777_CALMS|nr:unnamed protein product [Callosobruchus maculatus]